MTSPYWTQQEAAEFLKCSVDTLNRRRRAGDFREGEHFKAFGSRGKGRRSFLWFPWKLREAVEGAAAMADPVPLAQSSKGRAA